MSDLDKINQKIEKGNLCPTIKKSLEEKRDILLKNKEVKK